MRHHNSISLEGNDWRLGYKKIYDGSGVGTIAEAQKMSDWIRATVPGNVRADMMAAERMPDLFVGMNNERAHWLNDCVWWYEKRFAMRERKFKRFFLEFCGIDYLSEVYLNDNNLGRNEGMFTRHIYDVSSIIRDQNIVNVRIMGSSFLPKPPLKTWQRVWGKVAAPLQSGMDVFPERMGTLKCQMSFGWDFAPDMRTMGIWDEVTLIGCGNVFIEHVDVLQTLSPNLDSANLKIKLSLNSNAAIPVKIAFRVRPENFEGPSYNFSFNAFVKKGTEIVERNIELENPQLWNPWDRGKPNLYEFTIRIISDKSVSDEVSSLIGLKDVTMVRNPNTPKGNLAWTFLINGHREFIRGANWVPVDSLMGRVGEKDYVDLIQKAREAHINMFRVWGGGLREKRYFYELCSREGILVWQELPFACVFLGQVPTNKEFLDLAEKEVTSIVKSVNNYPCVALLCGGNEFSPSRNAKLLTRISKAVKDVDPNRLFLPASPAKGDNHNWLVWHGRANIRDYREDNCQFASEFGLQAAPSSSSLTRFLTERGRWPAGVEWEYHKAELEKLERYVGKLEEFREMEQFADASQKMQAFALQTAIEHYRRRKYECSGTIFWQFNDPWPAISWSVIDYYRNPKRAYNKLKGIYNPVLISLKYELGPHSPGEVLPIDVWVVNDFLTTLEDCMLDIHMDYNGSRNLNLSFALGDIPPDSAKSYVQFSLKLPDRPAWPVHATLRSGEKILSTNNYELSLWDSGEATRWNRIYDQLGKMVIS